MAIDVYAMVTGRIIEEMEKGIIPWMKPWKGSFGGRVYNYSSKREYHGINRFLLKHDGEYDTFNGWKNAGGRIKKGEKAEFVVFFTMLEKDNKLTGEKEKFPYLKYYNVFHISQVDGVEPHKREDLEYVNTDTTAEEVIANYIKRSGIKFNNSGSDKAFYSPVRDYVEVPSIKQYSCTSEYYSTTFHELVHSTGHKTRLDRLNAVTRFGSESYSKEELIAEIGACTLLNILGLETQSTFRNSTAYLENWLSVLKNDKKMIVSASGKSEKAVEFILGQ